MQIHSSPDVKHFIEINSLQANFKNRKLVILFFLAAKRVHITEEIFIWATEIWKGISQAEGI